MAVNFARPIKPLLSGMDWGKPTSATEFRPHAGRWCGDGLDDDILLGDLKGHAQRAAPIARLKDRIIVLLLVGRDELVRLNHYRTIRHTIAAIGAAGIGARQSAIALAIPAKAWTICAVLCASVVAARPTTASNIMPVRGMGRIIPSKRFLVWFPPGSLALQRACDEDQRHIGLDQQSEGGGSVTAGQSQTLRAAPSQSNKGPATSERNCPVMPC